MSIRVFKRLWDAPVLKTRDIFLTLVPALFWVALVLLRPHTLIASCVINPVQCSRDSVVPLDQSSLGHDNAAADQYSYLTQNLSGIIGLSVPVVLHLVNFFLNRYPGAMAVRFASTDIVLLAQTTSWNGLATEISHAIAQRPRPFVYANPGLGKDSSNYTSFYSGHTSFSAAATTAMVLILMSRGVPWYLVLMGWCASQSLIMITAMMRILAGRHFLTDVVCGAVAGTVIALVVAYLHREKEVEKG